MAIIQLGSFTAECRICCTHLLFWTPEEAPGMQTTLNNHQNTREEISGPDLSKLLAWHPHRSTLQRLGFLSGEIQADHTLTDQLFDHLKINAFYLVVLSPKKGKKEGTTGNQWKVDVNLKSLLLNPSSLNIYDPKRPPKNI